MARLRLWFRLKRTLIAAVIERTDQRDDLREHGLQAIADRDHAWREAARLKAERDQARRERDLARANAAAALR